MIPEKLAVSFSLEKPSNPCEPYAFSAPNYVFTHQYFRPRIIITQLTLNFARLADSDSATRIQLNAIISLFSFGDRVRFFFL